MIRKVKGHRAAFWIIVRIEDLAFSVAATSYKLIALSYVKLALVS